MKAIASIVLVFLLGTMFVSLFHISMGMDMRGEMKDCPFMVHGESVCPMNLMAHITAWKSTFTTVLSELAVCLLLLCAGYIFKVFAPHITAQRWKLVTVHRSLMKQEVELVSRMLQEFFSDGILHTKVFQ